MSATTYTSELLSSGFPSSIWTALKTKFANSLQTLQINQLVRALNTLSDDQLAHLGTTRANLRAHATKVLNTEYTGL